MNVFFMCEGRKPKPSRKVNDQCAVDAGAHGRQHRCTMKIPLLIAGILAYACSASADTSRFISLVAKTYNVSNQIVQGTASIDIERGQVARVVTLTGAPNGTASVLITKDGVGFSSYTREGPWVVEGPAKIAVTLGADANYIGAGGLLTLEILPAAVDPGKTLIVPQSTNAVHVSMEWSTNLVHWSEGTNSVYSTTDAARFFRVKVQP